MIDKPSNNKTVLIADSAPGRLGVLGKRLRSEGFSVLIATTGKQTLAIVRTKQPHLLIVAAAQPDINGFEVCREIKEAQKDTRVIIISGPTDICGREKALTAGADDFVTGSGNEELISRIFSILGLQNEMQAAARAAGKKVLLVEDNELNQNYISAILHDAGFAVDIAENGDKALGLLEATAYDLLLTDINVPIVNGIELAKIVRKNYASKIPIIAISGHSQKELIDVCLGVGVNSFIVKPFTSAGLKDVINKTLSHEAANVKPNRRETKPKSLAEGKTYSHSNAIEMSQGNTELLQKWIARFRESLKSAQLSVDAAIKNNNYPERQHVFHEMLNYSGYFGLDELSSHIHELNSIRLFTDDKERLGNFYRKIKAELESISNYYNNFE